LQRLEIEKLQREAAAQEAEQERERTAAERQAELQRLEIEKLQREAAAQEAEQERERTAAESQVELQRLEIELIKRKLASTPVPGPAIIPPVPTSTGVPLSRTKSLESQAAVNRVDDYLKAHLSMSSKALAHNTGISPRHFQRFLKSGRYVSHFETAQLSAAQSRRVEGHQHGAVIEIPRRANQLSDLIRTEDHRQPQALLWIRQILLHVAPLQHFDIEEAERANVQDDRVDGQLPRSEQVRVVAPKIIGTNLVNRRIDVPSEMLYSLQVRVNGGGSVVAAYELFSHPRHEYRHRNLL
jgi:hypothetical protein